ncbi:ABC transporter permease [Phytomonospora sp. NPDC050363]|uniref:ABC transporter permease n=1 Tax=Phytomonospora sp. NPDC050363 TaxID=3155642 RepID=UPI0033C921F3
MTVTTEAAVEVATDVAPSPSATGSAWHLLITPAIIVAAGIALFVGVRAAEPNESELRSLEASFVLRLLGQHISLAAVSSVIVLAVAIPVGIALSRKGARLVTPAILGIANIGQGAPAIGVIVILAVILPTAAPFWVAILALSLYSVLPALRNTMVGLQQVDPALVEAGRGIGMSATRTLLTVELPLAAPIMLAGIRTTLVLNVGVAALAAFIGAGGLGEMIAAGVKLQQNVVLITGSVLIAMLALGIDWLGALAERYLRPKGV